MQLSISKDNFYIIYNGRLANEFDVLYNGSAVVTPRFFGGKGGFGSMLRAIGAQIEKTTNREACRDLSGRRLRDINEEKRLKAWLEKQSKSQEEASERKKKKLEKLCSEPKHEFKDQKYDDERSVLTERVADAVEEGFKAAAASTSGIKRTAETEKVTQKKQKVTLGFGLDLDSDELDSSDDDSSEPQNEKQSIGEENSDSDKASASNDATPSEKSEVIDTSEKNSGSEQSETIENLDSEENSVNKNENDECKEKLKTNGINAKIELSVSN